MGSSRLLSVSSSGGSPRPGSPGNFLTAQQFVRMRLLNTRELQFKEFLGADVPPYAILSHVWCSEEVSYADFLSGKGKESYGYQKILKLCEMARNEKSFTHLAAQDPAFPNFGPLDWCWIDTCCIDKSSSAELSEAINSMFNWYQHSAVCFVFMPDVHATAWTPGHEDGRVLRINDCVPFLEDEFAKSVWFTRGWTLQELIAPKHNLFVNTAFNVIGWLGTALEDQSFPRLIERICLVDAYALLHGIHRHHCVAQRMSWAARRQTTRQEDMAYCLMGLFGVNLPLLYGEGATDAFFRLQAEIMSRTRDDSIFAWDLNLEGGEQWYGRGKHGLLASSPFAFKDCSQMRSLTQVPSQQYSTITQRGVEVHISRPRLHTGELVQASHSSSYCIRTHILPLDCESWTNNCIGYQRCHLRLVILVPNLQDQLDGTLIAWRTSLLLRTPHADSPSTVQAPNKQTESAQKQLGLEPAEQANSAGCGIRQSCIKRYFRRIRQRTDSPRIWRLYIPQDATCDFI